MKNIEIIDQQENQHIKKYIECLFLLEEEADSVDAN